MAPSVALITRSSGVVGRATALQLATNGFDIAVSDDPPQQSALSGLQREIRSKGVRCESFVCDLLNEDSIKDLIDNVARAMGGVDVMFVNSLDFSTRAAPITDMTMEDWDRTFAVNTRATFMCYKHAAAQMIKQGRGGRLIVRFSGRGIQATVPNVAARNAAMFAMRGLSQTAALELGPQNITVNMVINGVLDDTDEGPYGYKEAVENFDQQTQQLNPDKNVQSFRQIMADRSPLPQKTTSGQDIAPVVALLASKDCNFMTGQSIVVDGGVVMN